LDAVFDLLTVRSRAAFGVSEVVREHLEQAWQLEGTDRFVAVNGSVVGYATLDSASDVGFAAADPGVNDALLDVVERRARERGFDFVTAIAVREDEPFDALVRRSGFESRGEVLRMWRQLDAPIPEPAWAEGARMRTYEDADARAVQSLLDEAYAWDDTHVPRPHDEWLQWMTVHDEFDPALWFLVERKGELVACALHWREHQQRGWVKDIVVRESQRGLGLGKALLHAGFSAYAKRGVERVGLKVDSTNPTGAVQLYERVGFETERRYGIWVKQL
jgi:ribosomal protein S18 acetylase RimI-like enzyme